MMAKMLDLSRVCVPLCMECDLSCRYCYRADGKRNIPAFNELMRSYLRSLSPLKCKAVVASGGEPLLRFDLVKELFSLTPQNVHKRIMTNGLNLTEEVLDYINKNEIEVHLSHDGACTEYLRGVDIFKDTTLLALVKQIKNLKVFSVCTAKNPNPYENYLYVKGILGGTRIRYDSQPVFLNQHFPDLVEGFDYSDFSRGYLELVSRGLLSWKASYCSDNVKRRSQGFNVLPDGSVVGMNKITHTYGTVADDWDTLLRAKKAYGDDEQCENQHCRIRQSCRCMSQLAGDHACKCIRIEQDVIHFCQRGMN